MDSNATETGGRWLADFRQEIFAAGERIRVLFTDIDGTLVGKDGNLFADGEGAPSAEAPLAIASLAERNIELVLISGRRADHVAPLASLFGASGYIAEMGTLVVVEAMSARHSHNEVIRPLGDYPFGDEAPYDAMLRTGVIDLLLSRNPGVELHKPWHDERETSHLLRGELDLDRENAALDAAGHSWCEIVENGTIPHRYEGLTAPVIRAYHVVPKGTGKGQGVRTWLQARGIPGEAAAAIGDGRADLEMAGEVGLFFLMRNGVDADPTLADEVLRYANAYVTGLPFGAGWREATDTLAGFTPDEAG